MENLATEILEFIEKFAQINPNFDAEYDDVEDRFTSPDASELYNSGILLSQGIVPKSCNSSFEGCGYTYTEEVKTLHNRLVSEVYNLIRLNELKIKIKDSSFDTNIGSHRDLIINQL